MRRIVEFGCGPISHIDFQPGDIYLACDPMLDEMKTNEHLTPPPEFVTAFMDNHALGAKQQNLQFTSRHEKEEDAYIYYGAGWLSKHQKYKTPTDLRPNEIITKTVTPCTTLDLWLQRYETQGFLESIDFMYCNMPIGVAPILENFSFCVKPNIIMVSSADTMNRELFTAYGYACLNTEHPFLAVLEEK